MSHRRYTLRRCRHTFHWIHQWYKRYWSSLPQEKLREVESELAHLDEALLNRDRERSSQLAKNLERFGQTYCKKRFWDLARETLIAIVLALLIATVVRQVWFELYQIPTGSMRPTYREMDRLLVNKTSFGLNIPLYPGQLYFDDDLVKRTGVVVFTGHGLDLPDTNDRYFWLFPYKKRYIKRLIGKPGDTLYFYGGKIWGIDKEGAPIEAFHTAPTMAGLEHIPFSSFEGRHKGKGSSYGSTPSLTLNHMNQPVARLEFDPMGRLTSHLKTPEGWVKEQEGFPYYEYLGMKGFAKARLLTKEQLPLSPAFNGVPHPSGILYLELKHHPQLKDAELFVGEGNRYHPHLKTATTLLPLEAHHVGRIKDLLYTNRFTVNQGYAARYGLTPPSSGWRGSSLSPYLAQFKGVPDGTYEFFNGQGLQIGLQGWSSSLSPSHPLNEKSAELIASLFNLGMEWYRSVEPSNQPLQIFPSRFAYFREGDLYVMGGVLMKEEDPTLQAFLSSEIAKGESEGSSYLPFVDPGPPLDKDGQIHKETLLKYGIQVPEGHYLVLGDNHASSADSRYFGFVPQNNLRGTPTVLLSPFDPRWGMTATSDLYGWNVPTLFVWATALSGFVIWLLMQRRKHNRLHFTPLSSSPSP